MRFAVILFAIVGACAAARLDNTYLPPESAGGAGGSGNILGTPLSRRPSDQYGAPLGQRFGAGPSKSYGAPGAGGYRSADADVPILKYNNENNGDGQYRFEIETANGIRQEEQGELVNAGTDAEEEVVHGSYSFTAPDGVTYTVTYKADADGFHAEGAHLPTPPPIPEAILKSLAFNAAEEAAAAKSGYRPDSGAPQPFSGTRFQPAGARDTGYKY